MAEGQSSTWGGGARGGAAAQPKDGARRDALIGVVAAPPSADDAWLRLEELAHCPEKVAEYDTAAPRRHAARWSVASSASVLLVAAAAVPARVLAPLMATAGFRLASPCEVVTGSALVGRAVLYRDHRMARIFSENE